MKKEFDFIQLFDNFISESRNGKRLKKNGTIIRLGTIRQYEIVRNQLGEFRMKEGFPLIVKNVNRFTERQMKSEKVYWKRFYRHYTDYLYSLKCYDNYVGSHIKIIRAFFNYLNQEKGIITGDFYKNFYVRRENIPIIVLNPEQLQFLIYNKGFEESLPCSLQKVKDIFVFGCNVGLRFSDLMNLTKQNLERSNNSTYLRVRAIKTSTETKIKLSGYTLDIIYKYRTLKTILPRLSNDRLNDSLKVLCEKAGWTNEIHKEREKRGAIKKLNKNNKSYRFCDLVTTHTMRRTAITTLLSQGMPETMVRKISGHSANSKEFYRYVNYAQQFIDKEIDRIYSTLFVPEKIAEIC